MKKLRALILLGAALAVSGSAARAGELRFTLPKSTTVYAAPSTNYSSLITIGSASALALQFGFKAGTNTTTNVTCAVEYTLDKSNWYTWVTWTAAANGTNMVYTSTNLTSLGAVPYFRFKVVHSESTTNTLYWLTGLTLTGYTK